MKNPQTLRSYMSAATIWAIKIALLWQSQLNQLKFREPEWFAHMETVLEMLNEGVVIADDRPRILFANSRFVEMIGILRWN